MTTILSHKDVEELLSMDDCIDLMDEALRGLARNDYHQPLRSVIAPPQADGVMAVMPAFRATSEPIWAMKLLCLNFENAAQGLDPHQGAVIVSAGKTGEVIAIANASAVTTLRTAAVSAVATRALARPDAQVLAIVGAGVQARAHLRALRCVQRYESVRIASRTYERARALAMAYPGATAVADVETAVRDADVVVTATTSGSPVVHHEWLAPGTHIVAVGAGSPASRELDTRTIAEATLFVDQREAAENESGDYLIPLAEGAIHKGHIRAELGDVLLGRDPGRTSDDELTVFKSVGLAAEDLAVGAALASRARERGVGTAVDL